MHERVAAQLNECAKKGIVSVRIVTEMRTLILNDRIQVYGVRNYRSIACLNII